MTDFPCMSCSRECITDTIQCNECQRWVHRECVPLTPAQLSVWSSSSLCFLCRHCCFTADQFDSIKSLARVKTASQKSLRDLKAAVRSEQMLLTTYSVSLPPYDDSVAMPCDSVRESRSSELQYEQLEHGEHICFGDVEHGQHAICTEKDEDGLNVIMHDLQEGKILERKFKRSEVTDVTTFEYTYRRGELYVQPNDVRKEAKKYLENPDKFVLEDLLPNPSESFAVVCVQIFSDDIPDDEEEDGKKMEPTVDVAAIEKKTKSEIPEPVSQEITDISQLQRGDHVAFRRLLPYQHHGIVARVDVSNRTYDLIHFTSLKSKNIPKMLLYGVAKIYRETDKPFDNMIKYLYNPEARKTPDETVQTAEEILEKKHLPNKYNLLKYNCEHFATFCATGMGFSRQVYRKQDTMNRLFGCCRGRDVPDSRNVITGNFST